MRMDQLKHKVHSSKVDMLSKFLKKHYVLRNKMMLYILELLLMYKLSNS